MTVMCTHDPACPPAGAIDWWAARNVAEHPAQGWTLLCNGALVFDDHGALLPDGRVAGPGMAAPPSDGPSWSDEQLNRVFHELHADGRHPLCAVCAS